LPPFPTRRSSDLVGAGGAPARAPARAEGVAAAEPRDGDRLRRVDLAVVVEHRPDARLGRETRRTAWLPAVAVDDALLAHRGRAGAEWIRIRVPAVPDPAADGGDPIAVARPGEDGVLADLELPLEVAGLLAVRPD